jgi:D-alanyl-D-alanine carboxypeptidase
MLKYDSAYKVRSSKAKCKPTISAGEEMLRRKIPMALIVLMVVALCARADSVDDFVMAQMRAQQIPGLVLVVVKDGEIVTQRAYGLANIEFNVPMKIEDVFTISSITKLFTTTAVFEFVQEGKLRLDDKVTTLLPGLPETWNDITILHCLSHTSGLPDLYEGISNLPIAYTPAEAVKKMAPKPLAFRPGEKSRYNQTEFLLLRMVIERVSGKSFEALMAERIFTPLGMRTAQFADTKDIIPNKATLYSRYIPDASRFEFVNQNGDGVLSGHQMWIVPSLYPESVRAGAGLVMSALDLAKFDAALSAKTLLNARTIEKMWEPVKLLDGRTADYAAGWRRWVQNGNVIVGHTGGSGVEYDRIADGHYSVILLTDCPGTNTHSFALGVLRLYVPSL